jgi:cell wall-associated NlpC family hydrolase
MASQAAAADREDEGGSLSNMKPLYFFDDPDRVIALQLEAQSWIGTPFREYSKAKGKAGGVDCVNLCECLLTAVGVGGAKRFSFPATPMDYSQHCDRSVILEFLRGEAKDRQSKRLAKIFVELLPPVLAITIMPGDLLAFKIGRAVHHVAVALDERRFIHTFRGIGTITSDITDSTFEKRLHTVFRARA